MFTGIVEEFGKVLKVTSNSIAIECDIVIEDAKLGDSIAVNGVCLTVVELMQKGFVADVSPETFRVSALGKLKSGDFVNLERAMKADGRFGGHMVSGHIDNVAKLVEIQRNGEFYDLKIELDSEQAKYVIKKGSIAINGISLTIANVCENTIDLAIIPHTFENTALKFLQKGDIVNIEVDIVAKYIEKFLSTSDNKSRISLEFLQENGF